MGEKGRERQRKGSETKRGAAMKAEKLGLVIGGLGIWEMEEPS